MRLRFFALFLLGLLAGGCATPHGASGADKRQAALSMRQETLNKLFAEKPEARAELAKAPGHAVFSNVGVSALFFGAGNGYGVVTDRLTGQHTYMRMAEVSAGLGVGLKDFRAVFVFTDAAAMRQFVEKGWQLGGEAEAGLTSGSKGGEAGGAIVTDPRVKVYQFTEAGIVVRVGFPIAKYWPYDELN